MQSDPECVFCKIVAGEIPCLALVNDDAALAFLDISPLAEGHVLLIPKAHYRTLEEMPAELAARVLGRLPALAKAVRSATGAEGYNVLQNNGRVAHQFVPHVHFHVIPRSSGDEFHFNWPARQYTKGRMEELAAAIKASLEKS